MKRYISLLLMAAMSVGVISCTKTITEEAYEKVPPGPVSNVEYEPDYGGGILSYTIPNDPDFLYVRAEFTIENGMTISRTSSRFNNFVELTGMGVGPYDVRLYAVDVNGNESEPVLFHVEPKGATVGPISETIELTPGFGLFYISLQNEFNTVVDIKLDLWVNNEKIKDAPTFTTSAKSDRVEVKGLQRDVEYTIDVKVVDNRYGYESEVITYSNMQILYDDTLDMKPLRSIDDPELYGNQWDKSLKFPDDKNVNAYEGAPIDVVTVNGKQKGWKSVYAFSEFRNGRIRHTDGSLYRFWDGLRDTHFESGDWSEEKGPGWPWNYFIDMGREVQISRFRVWQVEPCAFNRNPGGCKTFEMWGSNDPNPEDGILDDWTLIGRYTFVVPANEIDKQIEIEEGTEFQVGIDDPQFSRTFRYWRFRGIADWVVPGIKPWYSGRLADIILLGKEVGDNANANANANANDETVNQ